MTISITASTIRCTARAPRGWVDTDNKVVAWRAPQRVAELPVRTSRPIRSIRSSWNWHGLRRHPASTCPICGSRPVRRSRTRSRLVPLGQQRGPCLGGQSFVAELAHALGRDPKDILLELIGPARIVDPRKMVTSPSSGTMVSRLTPIPSTLAGSDAWPSSPLKKPNGAASCRKAMGLALLHTAVFVSYVATVVEVAVDDKGNWSGSRGSIRPSIVATRCSSRAHPLANRRVLR